MELFGYDLKLLVVAGLAVLTWIFLVAGTATPFAESSIGTATLFESCSHGGGSSTCTHTFLCNSVDSTVHGGAAFAVMSILAWSALCGVFIGRIFFPAFFDRPQMPMIIYVGSGVIEFMLLIAWACAFGAFHKKCDNVGSYSDLKFSVGPCGVLLLLTWLLFIPGLLIAEWKMPAGKSASDNYNAVGNAPQHVAVASDTNNQYASGNESGASGYAEVSGQ